ncbi:unnamed protein product [Brugia timori]|uniref:Uncharacterized protein n=1 Tax=Brugia timori TaxID=42155 RepID=A0A3P7U719_9BILA|nr:unnamed protein product [Brugia timori]
MLKQSFDCIRPNDSAWDVSQAGERGRLVGLKF